MLSYYLHTVNLTLCWNADYHTVSTSKYIAKIGEDGRRWGGGRVVVRRGRQSWEDICWGEREWWVGGRQRRKIYFLGERGWWVGERQSLEDIELGE